MCLSSPAQCKTWQPHQSLFSQQFSIQGLLGFFPKKFTFYLSDNQWIFFFLPFFFTRRVSQSEKFLPFSPYKKGESATSQQGLQPLLLPNSPGLAQESRGRELPPGAAAQGKGLRRVTQQACTRTSTRLLIWMRNKHSLKL